MDIKNNRRRSNFSDDVNGRPPWQNWELHRGANDVNQDENEALFWEQLEGSSQSLRE